MSDIDVLISEVGPRDGLQSIQSIMPTEAKKSWIKAEAAAGVREIEVGSFVPPKLLPQMADTAEIVKYARSIPGLAVAALVPNFKGAENAIAILRNRKRSIQSNHHLVDRDRPPFSDSAKQDWNARSRPAT